LHQGPSITKFAKPSIAPEMLMPLLVMIFGFATLYVLILLLRGSAKIKYIRKNKTFYQASLNTRSLHAKNLSGESIA
jgi:heme exporter protein C